MSIFSSIMSKLFPASHPAAVATPTPLADTAAPAVAASAASPAPATTPSAGPPVDIEQVLNEMAAKSQEKLNWRTSIVDLMKLLGLDSSLTARKTLATELHYTGDENDSASMNMWLHKEVMRQVAANGGVVPADLKG